MPWTPIAQMEKSLKALLPDGRFSSVDSRHSRIMSAVKGKANRSTERRLRAALVQARVCGWELNASDLPGKPDFVFRQTRLAVFVDGCFWHGCTRCGHVPKRNSVFWTAKLERTRERDRAKAEALQALGYRVLRFWEHELQTDLPNCVGAVREMLASPV